jgi:hypothetical protein
MNTAPMERRHKILRNVVTQGNGKNMSKYLLMEVRFSILSVFLLPVLTSEQVNRKAHEFEMIPLRGTPAPPPLAPMELVTVQQRNIVFHGEHDARPLSDTLSKLVRRAYKRNVADLLRAGLNLSPLPKATQWKKHWKLKSFSSKFLSRSSLLTAARHAALQ